MLKMWNDRGQVSMIFALIDYKTQKYYFNWKQVECSNSEHKELIWQISPKRQKHHHGETETIQLVLLGFHRESFLWSWLSQTSFNCFLACQNLHNINNYSLHLAVTSYDQTISQVTDAAASLHKEVIIVALNTEFSILIEFSY